VIIPDDDDPFLPEPPRVSKLEPARPESDGRMPVVLEATRRLAKLLEGEAPVLTSLKGPFSLASFLRGIEGFLADLIDDPERARDFLKLALENQVRYAEAIISAGGVPFIGDPVASGSMVGSSIFRDFARPFLARLVDVIHENGSRCGLHICGETKHILKEMVATRADFLSLDEMDLRQARAEVGPSVVLMGNVSTHLMLEGSADKVAAAARVCLETGGPNLLLSTSCDVPPDTPKENVQAVVAAGRAADSPPSPPRHEDERGRNQQADTKGQAAQ
jgi:uroporphyrinogen decarboxylase